jgi:SAM-dependent methyltransferase
MSSVFDNIHDNDLDGWGFSFRRSQLFRFSKYFNLLKKYKINGEALEIGCSTGFFTNKYLKPIFKENLIGIDISTLAIEKARKNYSDISFEVDSLPKTKFNDGQFNLVTAIELLYYLSEKERYESLDEICRILKPEGYCIISVNIGASPYYNIDEIREQLKTKFVILEEDGLYIKTYYKLIEVKLWFILEYFSSEKKFNIKNTDNLVIAFIKKMINFLIKNKLAKFSYNLFFIGLIKSILYFMPISLINWISKKISDNELSIYIALAKKL